MWVGDGVLLAATFVWGTTFVIVRDAVQDVPPLLFIALRFTLATVVVLPLALRSRGLPDTRALGAGALVGFWLFVGFAFQTAGLVEVLPARAAFLTGLAVVLVPVLLFTVYRRLPSFGSLVGVLLATAGLALLTGVGKGGFSRSDLLVLVGATGFAFQLLAVDRYSASVGPLRLLLVELAAVALLAWPATLLLEEWPRKISIVGWKGVIITALLATLGALWAQNWAQQRIPPTRAAVILTMEPVFAALHSYLATGERFGFAGLAGAVLILSGMIAVVLLPRPSARGDPR